MNWTPSGNAAINVFRHGVIIRLKDLFVVGTAITLAGCASGPALSSLEACRGRVLVTVTNGHVVSYDVYYADSRGSTVLGEVRAGSTLVLTLPGSGQGQVWVQRAAADGGSSQRSTGGQNSRDVRIRKHCSG